MSLNAIYNDGRLFAAFQAGQRAVMRDDWMLRARERRYRESRQLCVRAAREANRELVRALKRLRRWQGGI